MLVILGIISLLLINLSAQKLDHVQGEILVQIKPDSDIFLISKKLQRLDNQYTRSFVQKEVSAPLNIWLLNFDFTRIDEVQILDSLKSHDEILVAQFNHLVFDRQTIPNDPFFNQQWQWLNESQVGGLFDADIDADLAWEIATGGFTGIGQEIVVCVIESGGADWDHEDLIDNHWTNTNEIENNGIDDDENGYIDDVNGWNSITENDNISSGSHGTSVCGMVGAVGNNGIGITGINWRVKTMQVVRGSLGSTSNPNEANVLAAYTYPLVMRRLYNQTNGVKGAFVVVTNASWGLDNGNPDDAPLWCEMYNEMGNEGILSCGATNNSDNVDVDISGDLPTACESEFLISVSSTNSTDILKAAFGLENIDLAAPGESVYTTNPNGNYDGETGTSFASPIVAGMVGLMYSAPCISNGANAISNPSETALFIRDLVFQGVDTLPNLTGILATGGRVNAGKSMQLIIDNCAPCPDPYGVIISNLTDTEVQIQWSETNLNQNTNLRWRKTGDLLWNELFNALSPLQFNNLEGCSEYEIQWQTECANTVGNWTESFIIKTDGCCSAPTQIEIQNLTDTTVTITWENILAVQSYQATLLDDQSTVIEIDTSGNIISFSALEPCSEYNFNLEVFCNNGDTQLSEDFVFSTPGCGACLDRVYCLANGQNTSEEWIENVTLNTINNTSQNDLGYGDYSGLSTDLFTYSVNEISLTPGFSGFSYNEYFRVWIDFNQDGIFNNDDELVFDPGETTAETIIGDLIIPGDALMGLTRMRVAMRFNNPAGACDQNFDFGEVEDYCVNIFEGNPPDCLIPENILNQNISFTEATITWQPSIDALKYQVRMKTVANPNWQVYETLNTNITFENLVDCIEYEYQVKSVCIGTTSGWSDSFFFETICADPCDEIPSNLDSIEVNFSYVNLSWDGTSNAIAYQIGFKESISSIWNFVETDSTDLNIEGLNDCTEYDFSVKALCMGSESEFSDTKTYKTKCLTGINTISSDIKKLCIYPNPFKKYINININLINTGQVKFLLYDSSGRKVYETADIFQQGDSDWKISKLENLNSGLYLLKIATEYDQYFSRIIKAN